MGPVIVGIVVVFVAIGIFLQDHYPHAYQAWMHFWVNNGGNIFVYGFLIVFWGAIAIGVGWVLWFLFHLVIMPFRRMYREANRPPSPVPQPLQPALTFEQQKELAWKLVDTFTAEFQTEFWVGQGMRSWAYHSFMDAVRNNQDTDKTKEWLRNRLQTFVKSLPPVPEDLYLRTPLYQFLGREENTEPFPDSMLYAAEVPYLLPQSIKYGGTWIQAEPDSGKTNLMHNMVKREMREVRERKASIFIMDSKANDPKGLLEVWRNVDFKTEWNFENVYVFDPTDKLAINIFDLGDVDNIVDLFEYIFSALFKSAEFTSYQSLLLTKCVLAIKHSREPSILALYDLLAHGSKPYEYAIRKLPKHHQDFFLNLQPEPRGNRKVAQFDSSRFAETRQGVLARLDMLLSRSTILYETLASTKTEIDLRKLIDEGSVIIVNAKTTVLGDKGAEFWQRLWTMMLLDAGRRRKNDIPVYCYIDEAKTLARDTKISDIIDELRAAKVALVISHQRRRQMELEVLDALEGCAIKFTSEPAFPQGTFTLKVRRHPVPLTVSVMDAQVERMPTLSRRREAEMKEAIRNRFSVSAPVPEFRRIAPIYAEPANDAAPFINVEPEYREAAEPEPEPFNYTKHPTVINADYTIVDDKPDPAPENDDPAIKEVLQRHRLLSEPPEPKRNQHDDYLC